MILYGNFNLNMENNIVLFRAVQIHIHADQICSIPKMKGFLAIELFFCFLNYPISNIYLFIYLLFCCSLFSFIYILSSFIYLLYIYSFIYVFGYLLINLLFIYFLFI